MSRSEVRVILVKPKREILQNSADLCVKNDIHSVGRAGHKANIDFCGSFQFLNSCFFLEELN